METAEAPRAPDLVPDAGSLPSELAVPTGPAAEHAVPPRAALARGRRSLWATALALAGFGALFALVKAERTGDVDGAVTRSLQRAHHPAVDGLMRAVSWPGFPPQSRIVVPSIAAVLWALGLRLEALFQLGAWSIAGVSTVLKALVRRERPLSPTFRVVVAPLGGTSFPSGHVLTYVVVYGFLAHLADAFVRPAAVRRAVVGGLVGLVALVGPSRIHQGHHWATDVLASYLLGLPFLAGLVGLYRAAKGRALDARR